MTLSALTLVPLSVDSYSTRRNVTYLGALQRDGQDLQRQLATGKVSETYSGLGDRRLESLNLRGRMAEIDGWTATIKDAQLRLSLVDRAMTQMEDGVSAVRREAGTSIFKLLPGGRTMAQQSADERLRQAVELLNLEVGGRFLMAGRASDARPVVDGLTILDGTATQDGLRTLIAERKQADLGTGTGRLTLTTTTTSVTIAEEAASLPFGIKPGAGSSTSANIAVTGPAGSPSQTAVSFTGQPADGDTVTVRLDMPDGTSKDVVMVARTAADPGSTRPVFLIGSTVADTVTSFSNTLTLTIQDEAATTLAAASAVVAAQDFFSGTADAPPRRVAGPPFASATGFVAGTPADTVIWYRGETAQSPSDSARMTSPVRVDGGAPIGIGLRANEPAFQAMMVNLSLLAAETFSATDPNAEDRYRALADRVATGLSATGGAGSSVQDVHTEIGYASAAIAAASERHDDAKKILGNALAGIEDADNNTVVAALLSLQTRLQASYQTTSMLSKLSLVNFLP